MLGNGRRRVARCPGVQARRTAAVACLRVAPRRCGVRAAGQKRSDRRLAPWPPRRWGPRIGSWREVRQHGPTQAAQAGCGSCGPPRSRARGPEEGSGVRGAPRMAPFEHSHVPVSARSVVPLHPVDDVALGCAFSTHVANHRSKACCGGSAGGAAGPLAPGTDDETSVDREPVSGGVDDRVAGR